MPGEQQREWRSVPCELCARLGWRTTGLNSSDSHQTISSFSFDERRFEHAAEYGDEGSKAY